MTSEQNPPDVHSHQAPPPPPPQGSSDFQGATDAASKSRRRRRKRKNKAAAATGAPVAQQSDAQPGSAPAASAPAQQQQGFQNNNSGGKRWKKKFRRGGGSGSSYAGSNGSNGGGSSAPQFEKPGPGNSIYENNNRRRNKGGGGGGGGRQRGGFVGPMDHSYRATDGNFAETPRSTIEIHGNVGGGHHRTHSRNHFSPDFMPSELLTNVRNIPIPADAPTKIFFFVDDLFVTAKVNETARKLGVKVAFVKNDKEVFEQLTTSDDIPGLIVFDLNNMNAKPLTLIPKLKAKLKKTTSIIGYLSHLQGDLKAKATEAGCDTVMPKSAFSQNLPNLLRRYGIEDKEEPNFNQ